MTTGAPIALLRADAGRRTGAGHLMRSLSVATELQARGFDTVFATSATAGLRDRVLAGGHRVISRPHAEDGAADVWSSADQLDDARRVAATLGTVPDVVVVDHYGLDHRWERHWSSAATRILALDDLANRTHDVDLLSDQNWYGPDTARRYDHLVGPKCVRLLGPRYAVLQPPYRALDRSGGHKRWPPRRCVVSFGGTDPGNETVKVVRALDHPFFAGLQVDVAVGSAATIDPELVAAIDARPDTRLHIELPSLAELFGAADLAIGASGAATWERIAARVPAVVATVAAHQSGVTSALAAHGFSTWIGLTSDTTVESYRTVLRRLWAEPPSTIPAVVDGYGAARLVHALVPGDLAAISVRRATVDDAPACAGLEAEVGADGTGLLDGPPGWIAATAAFAAAVHAEPDALWVVTAHGAPIGCARHTGAGVEVRLQACEGRSEVAPHVIALVEQGSSEDHRA